MIRVVGIDQSYTNTGVVVVEAETDSASTISIKTVFEGAFSTDPDDGESHLVRALRTRNYVRQVLGEWNPVFAGIEAPAFGRGTMLASLGGLYFFLCEAALASEGLDSLITPDPSTVKYWALSVLKLSKEESKKARKGKEYVLKAYQRVCNKPSDFTLDDNIVDAYFIAEIAAYAGVLLNGGEMGLDDARRKFLLSTKKTSGKGKKKDKGILLREGDRYITAESYSALMEQV